ncbi:MAG TPA: isoprenyl transferase [Chloroflexota bacterium]|nr:isoprenyl transferase [Chloroflexota bacterium]
MSEQPARRRVPRHVAFIMDGNGRWAKSRGRPRLFGHQAGTNNLRRVLEACGRAGIQVVTIYAFSTENWERPRDEVGGLFRILAEAITREVPKLHKNGVQIRHLGTLDGVPEHLARRIREALEVTRHNTGMVLNVAFNYGSRAEIVAAVRQIVADGLPAEAIDESMISRRLYTAGLPDPDLIVRTAGEMRLSNFLLWQAAYAEYYSTPVYWPDFDDVELQRALDAFDQRERRFGRVPEVGQEVVVPALARSSRRGHVHPPASHPSAGRSLRSRDPGADPAAVAGAVPVA